MDPLSEQIRKMIVSKQLKISMSEVSRVTGVSTSQLRYWERKGYISSDQDEQNKNHYFSFPTIFQVFTIKVFLDQGFTLTTAVKKEQERCELHKIFTRFITDCIMEIKQTGEKQGEVKLGPLAEDPTKEVYAVITDDKTSLHVRDRNKADN
ncbi:MerR family transcriptional regulator [Limosilactobacillus caviae]|uniref:MerR family transcriptional regulator n=1 Tax=Limosilactobacillus caviae TaxID=1769424 RepID=A0ABQ2C683_9LACO|nr:MerR family transcriptional regulator [Limosilactobacillus caviae]MCD7123419.1 MerR family transcriptional regulator [Limosilactobacillus caviae]MRH46089.1 MerR family transcriptional regulator [Limosilactobacillus reuteri]GGI63452.1 MerR family transcriptional regulator [Limosilactobacillus caviae]